MNYGTLSKREVRRKEENIFYVTASPDTMESPGLIARGYFIFPFARFKTFAFQANSFTMFLILNIEYRIRNFEQQKFFEGIRQYSSLRYSAACPGLRLIEPTPRRARHPLGLYLLVLLHHVWPPIVKSG